METRNVELKKEQLQVMDGKVVISSEELASIIGGEVDLNSDEEAGFSVNFGCKLSVH